MEIVDLIFARAEFLKDTDIFARPPHCVYRYVQGVLLIEKQGKLGQRVFDLTKELLYRMATRASFPDTLFEAIFEQGGVLCDMSQGPLEKKREKLASIHSVLGLKSNLSAILSRELSS